MKKVIICGGRHFGDISDSHHPEFERRMKQYQDMFDTLNQLKEQPDRFGIVDDWHVIAGGATGADTVAKEWALSWGLTFTEYKADWTRYGKAAGPIRNELMLSAEQPNLVIAFPGGSGTRNMIKQARALSVPVMTVYFE